MNDNNAFASLQGVDAGHLQALYGNEPSIALEMFSEYLREMPKDVADLAASYRSNDLPLFKTYLHKLKPGFTYVGLTGIADQVVQLEKACAITDSLAAHRHSIEDLLAGITASEALIRQAMASLQTA